MKNKKIIILISAVIIKICIGSLYSWSIYAQNLINKYNYSAFQTQIIFGITVAIFSITMLFAGRIEKKVGPKITSLIGAFFFILSHLLTWFSKGNYLFTVIWIGLLFGISIGFCYVSALVTPIKWFPNKKGLISGITVTGFGFGAIIHSYLVQYLLSQDINILNIFLIIGIIYGSAILICSLFLILPDKESNNDNNINLNIIDLLKDKRIISLCIAMFCGTFAGLLIIGNLKLINLYNGINEIIAVSCISVFSIGNSTGRIIWGYLSDKHSRKKLIFIALVILMVSISILPLLGKYSYFALLLSLIIGFGFSANFVLYISDISYHYGSYNVSSIYPYVFLFYGIAGIFGPSTGGIIFDITKSYDQAILVSILICLIGLLGFSLLYKNDHKKS